MFESEEERERECECVIWTDGKWPGPGVKLGKLRWKQVRKMFLPCSAFKSTDFFFSLSVWVTADSAGRFSKGKNNNFGTDSECWETSKKVQQGFFSFWLFVKPSDASHWQSWNTCMSWQIYINIRKIMKTEGRSCKLLASRQTPESKVQAHKTERYFKDKYINI